MSAADRLPPADLSQPADLRRLFRHHAAGVANITAAAPQGPIGFTATSLASVSAAPPLLSFNVARGSSSWPALRVVQHVGIHVLGAGHADLATRFATSGIDWFGARTRWRTGPFGVPLLDGVVGQAMAAIEQRVDAGDHVIVVAEVLQADLTQEAVGPLVHHDGAYIRIEPRPARPATPSLGLITGR